MTETSEPRFLYRSDLAGTPLPEVLLTIHKYRVPGTVDCSRGSEQKSIFIDEGNIIFASSNQTADSLGDRLLARDLITREQYDESVRLLTTANNSKRQGTILVEMGALQPKDLFVSVRDQVQCVVWSIFDWASGAVSFAPGREKHTEFIKLAIPIPDAVLEGVRGMSDIKRLLGRVGGKSTVLERNPDRRPSDLDLDATETGVLESIDGKLTLSELISLGITPPPRAARTLYALFILGLIQPRAARPMKVQFRTSGGKYE